MANGLRRLNASRPFLLFALLLAVLQASGARVGQCPDFPRQLSQNCPPHSTIDQCKYDEDCTENNQQKCCKIGCGKICLNPSDLDSVSGNSLCPALPRPSPCPTEPNQCIDKSECSAGRECCSDGCRMICVEPVPIPTTQAVQTFPWKSCNATVDVAFIIDSSGSIARRNYLKIKTFVKYIAKSFGISPTGSRAGIVLYSTTASVKAHFGQYPTTEEFDNMVDRLPHERGLTRIDRALDLASSELFPRARKDVTKIAMLLTDGEQTDPDGTVNLRHASAPLRQQGVRLIAFGVGKSINVRELRLVVERDEDVVRVMKFDDLITKVRNYTASLCQAAETNPIHPDADVIFLMDTSKGVTTAQFHMQRQFVRRMARYFIISPLGPRAAFATYGSRSYTAIGFSGYNSVADFSLQVNNARFLGGTRRIDQALNHAAKLFRETGRTGLRIVILLTAGNYYTGPGSSSMSSVMMPLRSLDAHLYVIGIGSQFTPWMFTQMVRGPKDIFQVPSFSDLAVWQSKIARQLRLSTNAFNYEPAYFNSDIIFLMDSSIYVSANNYILEKNFVKLMARLLNLANNRSRAALYTFSDHPKLQITFDGYEDREAFDAAVNDAPHLQGSRRIDRAFDAAAQLLRTKSRPTVPKYVILLTTGLQTRASDTRSLDVTSRLIRSYGGRVFVVAILTGGYSIRDFYPAVQRPGDAFPIPSYGDLLPRAPSVSSRIMGSWRAPNVPNFAADIAFVLDSSSAVTPFQYFRAKRFVRILSEYLNISPGKSRGSLVTFGESPEVVFNFDAYNTQTEFRNRVTGAPYLGGEPSVSNALRAAATLFSGARGSHPWLAILVTPWRPNDIRDTKILEAAARPLLNRGVWLYVLSIGENPYVGWLRPMVVEPRDAFSVVSYRDLPASIGPVASYITSDNYFYGSSTFQLDILLLMDTSSGVDLNDYKIEKGFVQRIAMHLGVFQGKSRAALVAYGANASVAFSFGGYSSNSEFLRLVNDAPSIGGERRVDLALDTAAAMLLGSRSTMPKAVLLFMAGKQSSVVDSIPFKDAARPLHQLGAWIYIMAIGQTDFNELQKVTIRPSNIFFAGSFSGLYGYIAPVAKYVANTSVITGTSTLNADFVFIIDGSSDVPYRQYGTQKAFVRSLAQYLNVQPGHSRLALIAYGSRAMPVLRFDSSRTIVRFYSELTKAPYLGGERRVDAALGIATRIFGNARENVPKLVLLFMAGKQSRVSGARTLQDSVKPLHQQGVRTFIFRIGSEPGIRELHSAVDRPENVITFANYGDMDARVPYVARHLPFYSALLGPLSLAVDVVYLLDSSEPVTPQLYDAQKSFVKQLSRYLNTMPARTRGAVVTYGSTATVITNFGDTSTTQEFQNAITKAPKVGGPRRMDSAIDSARNVFTKARPAVPKVVILITTGNQATGIQAGVLDTSFQKLYDLGTRLYAVTISPQFIFLPLRGSAGSNWFPLRSYIHLPIYVVPLARHVSYDTAALGPFNFVADVIFMLDSSSRVTPEDYVREKEFVKLIARYLNITPGKSRGSVIVFSTDAIPILPFDGYSTMHDFNSFIDKAPQLSGKRRIDRAFGAAATLFQKARPSARKIAILLTGGRQSPDGGSLEDALQLMQNRDVTTYVISIGDKSDVPVQRPEDLFYVTSYGDLPQQVQPIAKNITERKVTTPSPTTPAPTTPADPCKTDGCSAPYNVGCQVVENKAQCICPTCPNILRPVCASDDVQDLSECHLRRHACHGNLSATVAKQGRCDKECSAVVDIAFVVDSSGSIGRTNWERIKRFLKSLVSKLDVSESATRIAVVSYSNNPEVVMRFRNFQGTDQVNQVIDGMRWQRGYTHTDRALLLTDRDLFQTSNGMRGPNVPKLAVVITDGKQTTTGNYTRLSEASRGMKSKGVTVFALGVGSGADRAELEEIASSSDHVSISPSFIDLLNISSEIRQQFCSVPTQAPKVTTAPDPCVTDGCRAPFNLGCRVVDNKAECICPTCPNIRRPICATDDVQDLSECFMRQQACLGNVTVAVAKQEPCDKECSTVVDIAFVIDSSGSIGRSNWERMKRFVKSLVSKLDVSPSATHVAAVAYSTNSEVVMRFNGIQGTDEVNRKVDGMRWQRGYTYTDKALFLANRDLFQTSNGMRSNVPKLAVVITDGKQTKTSSYTELSVASRGMKNKGVVVYAFGVGAGADRAELEEIASGSEYVFVSASFNDLKNLAPEMRKRMCEVPTVAPSVTTPIKPDVCETQGCSSPYNIGCEVVDHKAQCICPTCPNIRRPVCASDEVQDLSDCHLKQQACLGNIDVSVAKQGQCEKECRSKLDIAFIIDSSGSIGRSNWERMKRFIKALISKLDVSPSATHVAAVSYSTNPDVVTRFRYYQGTDHVNRLIDRMRWQRGYTYTDKALLLADRDLFQISDGMREDVPKLAIVITDGNQTKTSSYTKLSEASRGIKNKGVIIYAVGVGKGAAREELEEIASGSQYVYTTTSFKEIQNIAPGIRKRLCEAASIQTTTVTPIPTTSDPCVAPGCNAPYNIGCRVVENRAVCICPTCPNTLKPVCASDSVQDLSECHLRRQACQGNITLSVAKQGPCDKECSTKVDIAFVIDSSGSIGHSNWERVKRFVKSLVSKLDVSPTATHVAAVSYSTDPVVVLRFNGVQGTDQVNQLLDRMPWQRGYTYTDKALLLADSNLFQTSTGMRLSVPKLAIVITDGKQTTTSPYTRLSEASRGMKNKGVIVYALGVGSGPDRAELEEIASGPENVFTSSSFEDLQNVASRITRRFCEVSTQTTTVTPAPTTADPCQTQGCRAPYNIGCRVVDNKAQCICPTCPNIRRPVCASDGVQDRSECHLRQQACLGDVTVAVTKQGPCDKICSTVIDIAFVIDSSGSIGRSNWEIVKRFVKSLVSKLDVSPSATHVAAISYSTDPVVVLRFNGSQQTGQVNQLLDRMPWQRGYTYTDKALLLADDNLFQTSTGMRLSVPKLAIVITDGKQTTTSRYTKLSEASRGMKNKGVIVYALGVGSGPDRAELEEIASGPENVFTSSSFKDLQNVASRITRRFCEVSTQTTTVTPAPTTADPCQTQGCRAPYNIGCRVVDNKAQCICPTCPNIRQPVCASDGVQDLSECHLRQQACLGDITVAVAKQGPCDKICSTVIDIAFVIDSSGSIGRSNWEIVKRFVKSLVSKLDVSPSATHVAAISYSTDPVVVLRFNGFQQTDQVNQLLDRMLWQRGYTYTDKALLLANENLFQTSTGMRLSVPKLAIVITDGKQTTTSPYTRLSEASRGMKNKGVIVYALGVGSGPDRAELEEIASGPENVFTSSSFKDLRNVASRITRRFCEVSTRTTTVTPAPTTADPCQTQGCRAPYNIGCRVVDNKAQCICPTCPNIRRPVCASDRVQDLSECHLRQQACLGDITLAVAKQGPCDKECSTVVDIAFVIDSSGSIGRINWERIKRFVKSLVSKLDVSPSATHVAAVSYSNNPEVVWRFNNIQGTDEVNREIDGMRWQRGFTYTDKALLLADGDLFQTSSGMRSSARKLAIVITDGKQTTTLPYTRLSEASRGMKNKGVIVYALGVGSGPDQAELEEIASGSEYVFTSSSFKDLQNIAPRITEQLCEVSTQTTTATPTPTTTVTPTPTLSDPCQTQGCRAPYNIGCRVVDSKAQCICPTCPDIKRPVCASDGVQDLSECHLRQQACLGDIAVAVAKQGPCDKECSTVVDIAFVVDSSGSIGRSNWERMKRFMKSLVSKLDVSPSATHVAAVSYSNNPEVVWRFNNIQGTDEVNREIDGMRWQRGFTYTDKALLIADRDLFQTSRGMRPSARKLAIVITDGKQTTTLPYTRLSEASRGMKNKGVIVYALGVGSGPDRAELQEIASGPEYVFTSSSFKDLQNIAPRITGQLCEVLTQTTTVTPTPTRPDPCQTQGCRAPYNIGCRVVDNKAQCICPTCPNIRRPVCASDGVQDLSECHLRQQACLGDITVAVAKQGPCDKECSTVVDIAFVVDSSGSIGRSNWERMKRFMKSLVSKLDVSPSDTHVAAVSYSNNPEVVWRFNNIQGTDEVNREIDGMRWQRGFTYTDKALLLANRDLFQTSSGMRPSARKLAIVITDGKQTTTLPYTRLSEASRGMKNKGVIVYALGVGSGPDRAELQEIASGPEYVFTSSSFKDLQNIAPRITGQLCEVSTQTTTVTPTPTRPDPCQTQGCRAPYNIGCRVVENKAQCICPACPNIRRPVCASDGVQDLSECHLRQQACLGDITVVVAKQGPCDKICSTVVDIAFVIDSSGSIGRSNWERMKRFVKSLVSKLDVSPSATHIAAVSYSTDPEVVVRFNSIQGTDQVNQLLDRMRWQRGFTYTDKALFLAESTLFQISTGMRSGVPKLAIVITDGKQTTKSPYTNLTEASRGIKDKGVAVYALGVGSDADRAELEEIASRPEYVFMTSSFRNLQYVAPAMTRRFCQATTEAPQVTTQAPTPAPTTPDPCETQGCSAPYNIGCRSVNKQAQCICPTCPDVTRPVCASDGVQDLSVCHLRQQACLGDMIIFPTKQEPCDKDCRPLVDIAFIVDSSGSIGRTNWERTKRFLKAVVSKLDVKPSATHVAAVAYSTYPEVVMRFSDAQDTDEANRLIDGMRWQRGLTYTNRALQLTETDLFQTSNGMRPGVAKIAIVITDGQQTPSDEFISLAIASEGIKNKGVTVYAIGVGSGINRNELEEIASSSEYVLTSSSFRALQTIAPQIRKGICEDPKTKYSADVLFVMDSSRETASTYNTVKDLIKSLAGYVNIDPQGTRAGLVVFNGKASVISDFESFRSASEFESTVDSVPHYGGDRSVSNALRFAAGMFPKSPSSASKIVFLVTSGKPLQNEDGSAVGDIIDKLSAMGVRTYIALIGQSSNMEEFRSKVENPENVFAIASRSEIPKQINQVGSQVLTDSVTPKKLNLTMYVLFVVDSSAEVTPTNFRQEKEFVKSLISQLNIYPGDSGSRVGIMVYSDGATMVLNFQNQETKSSLETIVDNLPHLKGARRIDRALKAAADALRNLDTDDPKFVVLVAGGKQTDAQGSQTFAAAVKPLHGTGTITHVMAVGDDLEPSDFQTDDSDKSNVISVRSFLDLPRQAARLSSDLLDDYVAPRESQTGTPSPTPAEETTRTETPTTKPSQTTTLPVKDGEWGEWKDWTQCSRTCGAGTQERLRSCIRPVCIGNSRETKSCQAGPCPVHGGWGPWGAWSTCTKTCGSGTQRQERRCDSPSPEHGGRQCEEPRQQSRTCNTRKCPDFASECILSGGSCFIGERCELCAVPSPVDIVFLLDTSNGVTQNDLKQQKEFTKLVGKLFGVAPSSSHAAVLSYSDRPRLIGGFYDHLMGKSFDDIVDSVTLTGGRRNIEEALKQTKRLLTSARPTVPYVVFLITYGQQAREFGSQGLKEMAQSVRDAGASLYVIGVGVDNNDPQLKPVVRNLGDFFEISSSSSLSSNVPSIGYYVLSRTDSTTPKDYKAEVIYVVDSSSFVGPENYRTEKEFVKALARVLNHSPTGTQSSVIIFDSFPETSIRMGSYPELGRFSEAVDNLRYLGGRRSQLDFALTFAARGFSTNRPDVPKIIIVLTNKDPPNAGSIDSLAGILRREGKIVHVIGVGNDADFPNLRRLVIRPEDMFTPKTFDNMMSFVPSVASNILALTVTPTTATTTTTQISTTVPAEVTTLPPQTTPPTETTPPPQTTPPTETTPSVQTTTPPQTTPSAQTTPLVITTPSEVTTPLAITTASTPPAPTTPFIPPTPPKKTGACPVKYTTPCPGDHLCEHDRQCPVDEKCCKHSCGFLSCTKMVQPNKPGSCPYLPRPPSCSSRPKECNIDIDCSGDLKCCDNGCGKICVSTDYTPPPVDSLNKCPPYQPNRQCPSSVQDECTCDSDCDTDDGYKCCFDGCRRFCRKKAGQQCTAKVDIIYLMDSSGSISANDFERQKDFVSDLARIFSIGPGASRAAVVTYHDYPTVHSNFGDFGSTEDFAEAVDSINQTRGRTRIDRALVKTSEMFKSARKNIPKVLIALTDGAQTPDPDAIALDVASQLLRDQNVRVFALGVGHYINVTQLRSMVESNSDVFLVDSFEDLLRKSQTIAEKACQEIVSSCIQGVDVAFLMDSSESITDEDFEREKTAVKEIARKFLKASPDSRAGVIMYSGRPELSIDFRSQSSLDNFQSAVDTLTHKRSMTRIDLALRYAAESLFLNPRSSVSSIAVVMTDGVQTPGPSVEPLGQAVLPLRSKGVRVLAVGVGPRVNRTELRDLVTSQDDVFQMSSFQELLDKSDKLLEAVCPHPTPPNIIITTTAALITTTAPITTPEATTTQPSTTPQVTTTAITTESDPTCDELFDIVFVMDSSRSINAPQYEQEKNFVKRLARIFNVGAGSRAAVIIYSDDTQLKIAFDQHRNLDNFLSAVDALPYLQKRTRIDKALALTTRVLRDARPSFPKAVIVMTDGRQTRDPDAVELDIAADPIHRQGARVLVVGIGPEISQNELRLIAKDPSYVFNVQSFETLSKAVRDVAASACVNTALKTTTAPVVKPGFCPLFPLNIRCAVTVSTCIDDSDCSGNLKCCHDNCRFICTRPDYNGITTTTGPLPYCPVATVPPPGSCSSITNTCLTDVQCSSDSRCCYDGCRFACLRLSVGGITGPTTPPPTTPPAPTCVQAFDLGIAMDSSGSIRDANYQRERNFIKGLADTLVVGPQNVQLGLIVFSDVPIISIRFGTLKSIDRTAFAAAVDRVPYLRGRTRIDSALQTAANTLFPDGRQNLAPQVFLLITDGRQSSDPGSIELEDAVRPLRDQGIKVIVVGIGGDVDENELRSIVENPAQDLFLVSSFLDLRPLLDEKKLTEALCLPTQGRLRRNRS